ncbi:hypothetical protein HC022_22230 [Salipiger sp. HF18]|nr:hypothetical protein [Salipiger sp. HF18]
MAEKLRFVLEAAAVASDQEHRGRAGRRAAQLRLANESIACGYPNEGYVLWMDSVAVLKDAQNPEAAKTSMNSTMEPKTAAMISEVARHANGSSGSDAFMPEDMKTARGIVIPKELKAPGVFRSTCPPDVRQISRIWTDLQKRPTIHGDR